MRCSTGETRDVVKRVDNNFDEMGKRLNVKYKRTAKVTDSILNQIKLNWKVILKRWLQTSVMLTKAH